MVSTSDSTNCSSPPAPPHGHCRSPGATLAGIRSLRSLSSCHDLRAALSKAEKLVVIGAGWIGSEVAASARQMGKAVAMIEAAQVPL